MKIRTGGQWIVGLGALLGSSCLCAAAPKPGVVVDRFGQVAAKEYPEKVRSEEELRADVAKDEAYYASLKPPARDLYGGLPGSREKFGLKKTGFFHIEKIGPRQVLVDPEGNLYFMLATGGIFPYHDFMNTKGREVRFEWLPPTTGKLKKAWTDKKKDAVSFVIANDIRKYGDYGPDAWKLRMVDRLRKWGFNGMNSYGRVPNLAGQTHYPTIQVLQEFNGAPNGVAIIFEQFADPFDPEAMKKIDAAAREALAPYAQMPEIIGYYVGNEKQYATIPTAVPQLDGSVHAKRRLVQMLKDKYQTIGRFNAAWKMQAKSFDDLYPPMTPATVQAGKDMVEYEKIFLNAYFKFITSTIRKYDPNHLVLGNRVRVRDAKNEILNEISGRYMDALSVNYYTFFFNKWLLDDMHRQSGGKPIILSEWNYDAEDQGLSDHLRQVANQTERGLAYRNYVETAASLPFVIGVQWWCTLDYRRGRQWNTGLINIVDRPYKDFLAEVMKTNYRIYGLVLGKVKPFEFDHPNFRPSARRAVKTVEVPRALPGMKVDGVQTPWPDRPGHEINAANLIHGLKPGKMEGDFWLCWDDTCLYLYMDIKDPTPRLNTGEGRGLWTGDAVELFLGAHDLDKTGELRFGDRQLMISLGRAAPPRYCWVFAPVQYEVKLAIVDRPDGQGCILEAGIPFEALEVKPRPDLELLFDIGLDDSSTGTGRDRQFMWNGTENNSFDRTHWGRAKLSG